MLETESYTQVCRILVEIARRIEREKVSNSQRGSETAVHTTTITNEPENSSVSPRFNREAEAE